MKIIIRNALLFSFAIVFLMSNCHAFFENKKKESMITDLEFIKRTMQVQYAPFDWKRDYLQWDLDFEYNQAVEHIQEKSSITTKEFQQIVKKFLGSTQDYHVDITFYSTESAILPFSVKTINEKCFIDWVDLEYWPADEAPIKRGDELIEFDGRQVQEVLAEIKQAKGRLANTMTDQSLADNSLTFRIGSSGDKAPTGHLLIKTLSATTGEIQTKQLYWYHQPEKIASPLDFSFLAGDFLSAFLGKKPSPTELLNSILKKQSMITPLNQLRIDEFDLRHGEIGATKSFLPLLGFPIWKFDLNKKDSDAENDGQNRKPRISWFAYIYKNENDRPIGYIRIPHYSGESEDFSNYLPIIAYLEKHTDALVIDQLNNPGGYVSFMYQLLSLLSPEPMLTPKHQVAINQEQVMEAVKTINELQFYLSVNEKNEIDSNNQDEMVHQILSYYQFIIDEWNNGEVLTHPTHLGGLEYIKPHPYVHYTKPILMLINELDFSAGDFTPAILQDNKRATLMGTKTAGAGGAVTKFSFPNRYGIKEISYTDTIAERINLQKIENLGVTPDIEYKLTEEDIRNGYQNYRSAINHAIDSLID